MSTSISETTSLLQAQKRHDDDSGVVLCFMIVAALGREALVKIVVTLIFILVFRNVSYAAVPYITNGRNVLDTILTLVN